MKRGRKRHYKFETVITDPTIPLCNAIFDLDDHVRGLVQAVHDVRRFRQMNAAETPDQQDAWDRLQAAVLKAEHVLQDSLDKPRQRNRESSATAGTNGAP